VNVRTLTEHNVIAIQHVRRPEMEKIMTGVSELAGWQLVSEPPGQ
jgi:hypothetical protein